MAGNVSIGEAGERVTRTCALGDSVSRLRHVSGSRASALERLGLWRVRDLLYHVPRRYLDFTQVLPIRDADVGMQATVVATVDKVKSKRPRPNLPIVELWVRDPTGVLVATFFKKPWLADQIHEGDVVALSGKVTFDFGFKQMKAPFHEVVGSKADAAEYVRVLPVHPVGEGISAAWMRRFVSAALADVGDVCDPLPAGLVAKSCLPSVARALRDVHFPPDVASAELARRRLAFDELLCLQLALLARQRIELGGIKPHVHVVDGPRKQALLAALPFSLTDEQRTCVDEILKDMASPHVMNRLLLGDVGTGKTAVAAVALAAAADSGSQAAVMAPTSVLVRQYAEKLGQMLEAAGITWALVTGATPTAERRASLLAVADGRTSVLFGTTAILSDDVEFQDLSLVVVDEQHRFGVNQRTALRSKGAGADMLTMTATPIPRTLALSLYGDLELSRITKRPRKGAGIKTKVVPTENLDIAYTAILEAIDAGRQAYVVCPLVDDTDDGSELDDVPEQVMASSKPHSAHAVFDQMSRTTLPGARVGLLTGRMPAAEKDEVMSAFRAHELDVVVATTVIEVGVDVPNACVMLVMDADRFGLATLHQLRGRVGRGDISGDVYLHSAAKRGTPARRRLAALEKTSDGFELAELDLRLRREGEVLGYRQSGEASLSIADLDADRDLVELAHASARDIVRADPDLTHPQNRLLAYEVRERFRTYFEEVERA